MTGSETGLQQLSYRVIGAVPARHDDDWWLCAGMLLAVRGVVDPDGLYARCRSGARRDHYRNRALQQEKAMATFTMEYREQCKSIDGPLTARIGGYEQSGLFSERVWPSCTCRSYRFGRGGRRNSRGVTVPRRCKHIEQAERSACGWHSACSTEAQQQSGVCPKCGGPTVVVKVVV